MAIECISISLYDTTLPAVSGEILDFAERGSIRWVYEGGDDKFFPIFASRLEFSLEVPCDESTGSLLYDYLFTGNETKYSVVMRDQDENVLWQGFLLPEEYSEPFVTGTFYVNLTATDGIGRLRGHKLDRSFYRARHSVIKVIADCLKKTGLSLQIWVDPAIHNNGAGGLWEYMYVDAQQWDDDGNLKPCYDILEGILTEMGCTVYQQNNRWYVQGINKRGTLTYNFRKYTANGIPNATRVEFTTEKSLYWYATPVLSIKAPWREITVTENINENLPLFPEDLINQEWTKTQEPQSAPYPIYWIGYGVVIPVLLPQDGIAFNEYDGEDIDQDSAVGFYQQPDVSPEGKFLQYITLSRGVYVKGGDLKLDFNFTFAYRIQNPEDDNLDSYINNNLWYELTLNGDPVISNKPGFPGRESYLWKGDIIWADGWTTVNGVVSVKGFRFPENGFVNFKFFHGATSISPPIATVRFLEFSVKYQKEFSNVYPRRRNIEFTATQEVSLLNGGSVFETAVNSFVYQPPMDPADFVEVPFAAGYDFDYSDDGRPLGWVLFVESTANQILLTSNSDKLYIKRENSDFYEYVQDVTFISIANFYVKIVLPDGHDIRDADQLLVRNIFLGNIDPQTPAVIDQREKWSDAVYSTDVERLGRVLAKVRHNIYPEALIAFEGNCKGLMQPKDVIGFEIKGANRRFVTTRITILPNENTSTVTLIEYKNEKVANYGS